MKKSRNISIFILFFALFTTVVYLFFGLFYTRVINDIVTDFDRNGFICADVGDDGKKYLLEYYDDKLSPFSLQPKKLRLVTFDGTAYEERNLQSVLPEDISIEQFYAGWDGTVMISFYVRNQDNVFSYVLYCLKPNATSFDILVNRSCAGLDFTEVRQNVRPSSITGGFNTDNSFIINMFIKEGTTYTKYNYKNGELMSNGSFILDGEMIGGVYIRNFKFSENSHKEDYTEDRVIVSLSDGTLYADNGVKNVSVLNFYGIDFTYLDVYTDKKSGDLLQINNNKTTPLSVSKLEGPHKIATSVDYGFEFGGNRDGGILVVYDYREIKFAKLTGGMDNMTDFEDYTKYLPATRIQSILIMCGTVIFLFMLSYTFYYLFCVKQRLYFPIAVRHMLSMSICLFWFVSIMFPLGVVFIITKDNIDDLSEYADTVSVNMPDGIFPNISKFKNLSYFQLYDDNGTWRVMKSNNQDYTPGFSVNSYELRFLHKGINPDGSFTNIVSYNTPTAVRCLIYRNNSNGLFVLVGDLDVSTDFYDNLLSWMYVTCGIIVVLSTSLARGTSLAISRVSKGVGKIATSEGKYKIVHNSCDEFQSFALTVNNFAGGIYEKLSESRKIRDSYLKFIPYHILHLMGIDSATEADKTKVSTRNLTLMSVYFRFPGGTYQNRNPQMIFDNINKIMADASKVIGERKGAIYNATYDSFDVVFEGESSDAVAAAVALRQEVIAVNKTRAEAGREPMKLCIAIEKGDAIMGFVDSDAHVVPAIVSLGLNLTRAMIKTALSVGANIVCTDIIAAVAGEYSVRYIGKTIHNADEIKIYELFDGDIHDERVAKEKMRRLFAEGLQKFYGRDFSGAKRVFMNIVHRFPEDSVNRHYLYLSDILEKESAEDIYIDYKSAKNNIREIL